MNELRAAIVGAGRLGTLHARKYGALPGVKLAFVVDTDIERARQLAAETGARALADHRSLKGLADLATVAVPGVAHHKVTRDLLEGAIDVLVEKPIPRGVGGIQVDACACDHRLAAMDLALNSRSLNRSCSG